MIEHYNKDFPYNSIMTFFYCIHEWYLHLFKNKTDGYFWHIINGCPTSNTLIRLLNRESFNNPTWQDMLNCYLIEGIKEEPTVQKYIEYREKTRNLIVIRSVDR